MKITLLFLRIFYLLPVTYELKLHLLFVFGEYFPQKQIKKISEKLVEISGLSLIMNRAVFLDRDGVLNEDHGFLHKLDELEFYPGVIETLTKLSATDYKIIIVTNQPGIGRGYYTEEEYLGFEKAYLDELARLSDNRIRIDKVYHCPHHPTAGIGDYKKVCECRKPAPGMLLQAKQDFNIDMSSSFMIGDRRSDIKAGQAGGCRTILVKTGESGKGGEGCEVIPDFIFESLRQGLKVIVSPGQ